MTERETAKPTCALCGEPMPAGEEMFKLHGYSGPCPKPALPPGDAPPSCQWTTLHKNVEAALGVPLSEDGTLVFVDGCGEMPLKDYLGSVPAKEPHP